MLPGHSRRNSIGGFALTVFTGCVFKAFAASASSGAKSPTSGDIAHMWANEDGDKVAKDDLRAADDQESVIHSMWCNVTILRNSPSGYIEVWSRVQRTARRHGRST